LARTYDEHHFDFARADLYNALAIIDSPCQALAKPASDGKIYCDAHMQPWPCYSETEQANDDLRERILKRIAELEAIALPGGEGHALRVAAGELEAALNG
jgi:hypothetical protein